MGWRISSVGITASLLVLSASLVSGQSVISARSGMVHYVEGQVAIDDKAVEIQYSQFPEVREKQVLKTEAGRAEVLLTPGVFLRLAENSSFRMISNRLTDTKVEGLTGSLMIEHGEIAKDSQVSLLFKDKSITFSKSGLYRLDADSGAFRVYQGEAKVTGGDQTLVAKQAHEVLLNAPVLTAMKFDAKQDDEFYRWASRRAEYLAMANISAAKSLRDSGGYGYGLSTVGSGMWSWNPYFGMFTYVPFGSMYNSPFGYSFYSPYLISGFYQNYPGYYGGGYGFGGGGGGGSTGTTRGSVNYATPSRPASTASTGLTGGGTHRSSGGFIGGGSGGGYSGGGYSGGGSSGGTSSGSSGVAASSGGGSHSGASGGHGR